LGYTLLDPPDARDGQEALRLVASFPGTIQLLLTDAAIPGMSGQILAKCLAPA
jgi:CheY-like chemotaxis protein